MGRNMQPASLISAKGRSHIAKAEIERREARELKVDLTNISPPIYLSESMAEEFLEIAAKLAHVSQKLFTELDEDVLARYLIAKSNYLRLTQLLSIELKRKHIDVDAVSKLQRSQNTAFNQCQTCASSLGLTITSRCKIVIPDGADKPKENKFDRFDKR